MFKYILIQLIYISFLFTFDIDEWTYLKKVGSIHSIIEDGELVHFVSSNGIYSYDDISEDISYNFNLSSQIDFNTKIYHFYFDSNTGMYWLIDEYGIKTKHSFHDFWTDISYRKLNIIDVSEILNLGASSSYIWIKLFDRVIPLDQITGTIIKDDIDYDEIDNIDWGTKYDDFGYNIDVDLSKYVIFDKWDIKYNRIVNNRGDVLIPTAFIEDHNRNIWIGTDKGVLFRGSSYSHRLEVIDFGLKFSNTTIAVVDDNKNWWFADSQFLRTGIKRHKENFRKNNYNFLSKWNEYDDNWSYIDTDFSMLIQNIDINDLLFVDERLYIATMDGLLIFDEVNNDWMKIDYGLYDTAIWDMEYYNSSIYIATSKGINEISTISNSIIETEDNLFNLLNQFEIYDILIDKKIMYIASEKGLFKKHFGINSYDLISDKKFNNIGIYNDFLFASDGDLWKINLLNFKIENFDSNVLNFSIFNNFIWTNHINYCELLNIKSNNRWRFDKELGLSSLSIYNVKSNNDKVWFMTNDGVAIFNWDISNYE